MAKRKTEEGNRVLINSSALNRGLKVVGAAIEANYVLPIVTMVHCRVSKEKMSLMTTNMALTIVTEVECESPEEFVFLMPHREATRITGELADQPLTIIVNKEVVIQKLSGRSGLGPVVPTDEFPLKKEIEDEFRIEADNELMYALKMATKCVESGELVVVTDNVCLDIRDKEVSIVATDKHQLYRFKQKVSERRSFVGMATTKFISAISHFEAAEIFGNSQYIVAKSGPTEVITRQPEGRYLDYRVLFREYEHNCTLSPKEIISAMKEILAFDNKAYHEAVLHFEEGVIRVAYDDIDKTQYSESKIKCAHNVETPKIRLNAAIFKNIISTVAHEEVVKMSVGGANRIVYIDTEDGNVNLIINPLMIN